MIRVTFQRVPPVYAGDVATIPEPRDIDADDVSLYEGWATFQKYIAVEGEKYKDTVFVEAIRLDKIDSIKRVDRIPEDAHP